MKVLQANKWLIGAASAALIVSATLWEGVKYVPYLDIGGVPTVCMGYTGKEVVLGKHYSSRECNKYLRKELAVHGEGVLSCVTKPLTENKYNAYTLFAYNVGVTGFCNSRAAALFNAGLEKESCNALAFGPKGEPVWSYVNKKFVQGLFNRRLYERSMCLGDGVVYKS